MFTHAFVSAVVNIIYPFITIDQIRSGSAAFVRTSWYRIITVVLRWIKQYSPRRPWFLHKDYNVFSIKSHIIAAGFMLGRSVTHPRWEPEHEYIDNGAQVDVHD